MTKREKAMSIFREGYSCSQSLILAFEDEIEIDKSTALKIASSFGAGMGRLREVCGAVTGMFIVAGILYGYDSPEDREGKIEHYSLIQKLGGEFSEKHGSIVCRELLGLDLKKDIPVPEKRTKEYYKKRPCAELVGDAAEILEIFIQEKK